MGVVYEAENLKRIRVKLATSPQASPLGTSGSRSVNSFMRIPAQVLSWE